MESAIIGMDLVRHAPGRDASDPPSPYPAPSQARSGRGPVARERRNARGDALGMLQVRGVAALGDHRGSAEQPEPQSTVISEGVARYHRRIGANIVPNHVAGAVKNRSGNGGAASAARARRRWQLGQPGETFGSVPRRLRANTVTDAVASYRQASTAAGGCDS